MLCNADITRVAKRDLAERVGKRMDDETKNFFAFVAKKVVSSRALYTMVTCTINWLYKYA